MAESDPGRNLWPQYASLLSGGWTCVSYELHTIPSSSNSDPTDTTDATPAQIHKPHGERPLGRVLISPSGFLSAHIANPHRFGPLPSRQPWQTAPEGDVAHVARGLSMYCGYLRLYEDEQGLYWETRVDVSSDPVRKGGLEVRRVQIETQGELREGGRGLVMTLKPVRDMVMEDGTRTRGVLKWEKFE